MAKKPTPETFDFADWFGDVGVPEESVDVFTRTDLVGEINALQRAIQEADQASAVEKSLGDEMDEQEARLAELLQAFSDSKVTFFLRGLTQDERNSIRKAHEASRQSDHEFSLRCISRSVVGLRRRGGEREKVTLSLSHVKKLHNQLGEGQTAALFKAFQQATSGVPMVDADFLLRRSGQENTEES